MRNTLLALLCTLSLSAAEVPRVPPWEFHSSFWMSLHQVLIDDAMRSTPREDASLTAEERATWNDAVAAYRTAAGGRDDPTFAQPMLITTDALSQISDDASEPLIDAPLAKTLVSAAPVYRAHGWSADDRANRFFIAYAAAMVREEGPELLRKHEAVYRTKWPERVEVYVTPHAGPFGAYTFTTRTGNVITTMGAREEGYQGFRALEMLLHESSHAVVGPNRGTVADAISAAAKKHGIAAPRDLWHALLFTTSGELTRRLLRERGIAQFVPSSDDLFARAWPKYKKAIETHWLAYLDGRGTLEEAIDKVVAELPK